MRVASPAASLRFPWAVGLVALLLAALAIALLPLGAAGSAASSQRAVTRDLAVAVAEGVAERLDAASTRLSLSASAVTDQPALDQLRNDADAVGLRLQRGTVTLTSGEAPARTSAVPAATTLDVLDGQFVVAVPLPGGAHVSGVFEAATVLGATGPAWLVDRQGAALARAGTIDQPAGRFQALARTAAAGSAGAQVAGGELLAAAAPVPADALPAEAPDPRWSVLVVRTAEAGSDDRVPRLLLALAVGLVAVAVFGWWEVRVLRRLRGLEQDVDRLLRGDLDTPVQAGRLDELGRVARGLERCRVLLLRRETEMQTEPGLQTEGVVRPDWPF